MADGDEEVGQPLEEDTWNGTGFTGLDDDAWTLIDESWQETRVIQERLIAEQIQLRDAVSVADISSMAPVASADLAISSSMVGLTFDDPLFNEILAKEQYQNEHGRSIQEDVWGPSKTALRVGFLGFQTLWDEGIAHPLRTGVQMMQGHDPLEAYRRAGTSAGSKAIANMLQGESTDLGTGILPGFTPIDESPAFAQSMVDLEGSDISGDEIVRRSLEAHFEEVGQPVVPMQQEVAESTLIHNTRGGRNWVSPVSLGRIAGIQAFEPGSTPFVALSGGIDFTSQILLDPADRMLTTWALSRKARKAFAPDVPQNLDAAEVAQLLENKALTARNGGIFGNTRFSVFARKATDWALNEGKSLREFLVTNRDIRAVDAIFPDLDASQKAALVNANTIEDVDAIIMPALGTTVMNVPGGRSLWGAQQTLSQRAGGLFPGSTETAHAVGRSAGMGARMGFNSYTNPITRLFSDMHRGGLSAGNPNDSFTNGDAFMRNAGFDPDKASEFLLKLAENPRYGTDGLFEVATEMMEEYGRVLVERYGWSPEMARAQTDLFGQQTIARIYNQDDIGNPILLSTTFEFVGPQRPMGEATDIPLTRVDLPEAHLLSEYLDWGIALPDARGVRRGRSIVRRSRRDARAGYNTALEWVNERRPFSVDGRVAYTPGEQAIIDMGRETFDGTGDVLHYPQSVRNEVIEEGGTARVQPDMADADDIAGNNVNLQRYTSSDIINRANRSFPDDTPGTYNGRLVDPEELRAKKMELQALNEELYPIAGTFESMGLVPRIDALEAEIKAMEGALENAKVAAPTVEAPAAVTEAPVALGEPAPFVAQRRPKGEADRRFAQASDEYDAASGQYQEVKEIIDDVDGWSRDHGVKRGTLPERRADDEFADFVIDTPWGAVTISKYGKGEWVVETLGTRMEDALIKGRINTTQRGDWYSSSAEADGAVRKAYHDQVNAHQGRAKNLEDEMDDVGLVWDDTKAEIAAADAEFQVAEDARLDEWQAEYDTWKAETEPLEGEFVPREFEPGASYETSRLFAETDMERVGSEVRRADEVIQMAGEFSKEHHIPVGDLPKRRKNPNGTGAGQYIVDTPWGAAFIDKGTDGLWRIGGEDQMEDIAWLMAERWSDDGYKTLKEAEAALRETAREQVANARNSKTFAGVEVERAQGALDAHDERLKELRSEFDASEAVRMEEHGVAARTDDTVVEFDLEDIGHVVDNPLGQGAVSRTGSGNSEYVFHGSGFGDSKILDSAGITLDIERATGYASTAAAKTSIGGPGYVYVIRKSDLPQEVVEAVEGGKDVERAISGLSEADAATFNAEAMDAIGGYKAGGSDEALKALQERIKSADGLEILGSKILTDIGIRRMESLEATGSIVRIRDGFEEGNDVIVLTSEYSDFLTKGEYRGTVFHAGDIEPVGRMTIADAHEAMRTGKVRIESTQPTDLRAESLAADKTYRESQRVVDRFVEFDKKVKTNGYGLPPRVKVAPGEYTIESANGRILIINETGKTWDATLPTETATLAGVDRRASFKTLKEATEYVSEANSQAYLNSIDISRGKGKAATAADEARRADGKTDPRATEELQEQVSGGATQDGEAGVQPGSFRADSPERGAEFERNITEAIEGQHFGSAVDNHGVDVYSNRENNLFISPDGKTGAMVTKSGDLQSVYRVPDGPTPAKEILAEAAEEAITLDAIAANGKLPNLYSDLGFVPVARLKWDPDQAPKGWPDDGGTPDLVLMVKDPDGILGVPAGTWDEVSGEVHLYDTWDEAEAAQKIAREQMVDAGVPSRITPPSLQDVMKSDEALRSYFIQQVDVEGNLIQVKNVKATTDDIVTQTWHTVDNADDYITAMGRGADTRILPGGRDTPTITASVYGKSLNVGTMNLSKADPKLIEALKADGILDEAGELQEGAIPLKATKAWMEENGYGKFVHEDDSVEALELFMGYNTESVWDDVTKGSQHNDHARKSDRLGRFFSRVSVKELGFDPAIMTTILDWYQANIFKPLVLLRAAWFARVTLEENVRMWLEGFDSFISHPFSAIQWTVNHNLTSRALTGRPTKGRTGAGRLDDAVDEAGEVVGKTHNYGEDLIDSRGEHEALTDVMDQMRMGRSGPNQINYGTVFRGQRNYASGWARDVHQIMVSPEVGVISKKGIDDTIEWMKNTPEGKAMRDRIANDTSPNSPKRAIADNDAVLRQHLESVEARMHRIAGGEYHVRKPDGTWVSSTNVHEPLKVQPNYGDGATYVIVRQGDAEVMEIMASGRFQGTDIRGNQRITRSQHKALVKELEKRSKQGVGPTSVKGVSDSRFDRVEGAWDKALSFAFMWLGSKPTNYLSRSPFYRQAHWDSVGRLYRYADDELRAFIDEAVAEANLSPHDWNKILKRHGNIGSVRADTRVLTIDDANMVDDIAKAQALSLTKKTLYDLSKRKNISDMTRFVFPFGEAFMEMLTVWARLGTQNPRIARRFQQGVNGARSSGFFHENDYGEEVFSVPGSSWLMQASGMAPEGSNLSIEMPVQGVNMITSNPLPGFGTVPQITAAMVLPTTGTLADIADTVIFGGFGRPDKIDNLLTVGIDSAVPPWFRHLWTGIGGETSEWSNTYAAVVNDTAEVSAITGAHPGMTNGDIEGLYADAKRKAQFLFIVRGIISFGSPSAPQLKWEVETADGSMMALRAGKEVWGDVLRANEYDRVAATEEFLLRVGFDPNYLYRSHYEEKWERTMTQEGLILEQQNPDQYAQFPATAAFAFPDPLWAEFSFNVHKKRILDEDKRVIDEDSHRALVNMQGGDLEYRNMMQRLDWRLAEMRVTGVPSSVVNKYEQDNKREITRWVESRWTGWGKDSTIGAYQDASAEDLWREVTAQHGGWFDDPKMMATDAGQGLAKFVPYWNSAVNQALMEGYTETGWLTTDKAIPTHMLLRETIDSIGIQHPDFIQLAREAIIPQLTASREAWKEAHPRSPQIFDYITPPDPTPSMEAIPFEMLKEAG